MTRKMQIFYTVVGFVVVVLFVAILKNVEFTSNNITNIIIIVIGFATAMAGANYGEHYTDMKKIEAQAKNG